MFETPLETSPCSRYDLTRTFSGIKRLEIDGELVVGAPTVRLVPPGIDSFPPFMQPITKRNYPSLNAGVVLDGRSLLRVDRTPVKMDEYAHAIRYAQLVELWYTQGRSMHSDMVALGDFPAKIFVSWLSGAVSRLGLDFGQLLQFRILAAVYYYQLFDPITEHSDQSDIERLLVRIKRITPAIELDAIEALVGKIPTLNTIIDFVKWVVELMDTPRLHQLNVNFIYQALGFSFSPRHRETVAVALEYPPAFFAMVATACLERSYQKSGLGMIIETQLKTRSMTGKDKEFIKNLTHLMGTA